MFDIAILVARLLTGGAFIVWGTMKLRGGEAKLVPVLTAMGLPDAKGLAYLVGFCELVGGIGVVIGWPLALVSVLLGLWCVVTAVVAHKSDMHRCWRICACRRLLCAGSGWPRLDRPVWRLRPPDAWRQWQRPGSDQTRPDTIARPAKPRITAAQIARQHGLEMTKPRQPIPAGAALQGMPC